MKTYPKLTSLAAAAGFFIAAGTASAQVIVFDAVATSDTNPFGVTAVTLSDGVTVTGTDVRSVQETAPDPTTSPWSGNEYVYRNNSATPGTLTYSAGGGYFTDFAAQIIVNTGVVGGNVGDALPRFTFESSTDGSAWSTISVSGIEDTTSGDADWTRVNVSTTELDALTDISFLRVTMTQLASGGFGWHQYIGSVSMDVVPVPEPSSFALLAGMFGLTGVMLRRRR